MFKVQSRSRELPVKLLEKTFEACNFLKISTDDTYRRIFGKNKLDCDGKLIKGILFYVNHDKSWECVVFNNKSIKDIIPTTDSFLKIETLKVLEIFFSTHSVCRGITGFEDVIQSKVDIKQPFMSSATCESTSNVPLLNKEEYKIIRHQDCGLMIKNDPSNLCENCKKYIPYLKKCRSRINETTSSARNNEAPDSSHTNYRYISREELVERLQHAQKKKKDALQKLAYINAKVKDDVEKKGVILEDAHHDLFQVIIKSSESPDFLPISLSCDICLF